MFLLNIRFLVLEIASYEFLPHCPHLNALSPLCHNVSRTRTIFSSCRTRTIFVSPCPSLARVVSVAVQHRFFPFSFRGSIGPSGVVLVFYSCRTMIVNSKVKICQNRYNMYNIRVVMSIYCYVQNILGHTFMSL